MPRIRKFNKGQFHGNRFTSNESKGLTLAHQVLVKSSHEAFKNYLHALTDLSYNSNDINLIFNNICTKRVKITSLEDFKVFHVVTGSNRGTQMMHGSQDYLRVQMKNDSQGSQFSVNNSCKLLLSTRCDTEYVIYYLYPRNQPKQVFRGSNFSLPEWYDSSYPLKVVIHGFGGGALAVRPDLSQFVIKAYVSTGEYNVLGIDYGRLAPPIRPCYPIAVLNSMEVGRCFGVMLSRMIPQHPPPSIHLVGFSLGAHIASFVANYLKTSTGQDVGRITGLEPALPIFAALPNSFLLDKADADFVDIVHSNAGDYGILAPAGHVDFYVNDGTNQGGCSNDHEDRALCSHKISNLYFAESISSQKGFLATQCSNYLQFFIGECSSKRQDSTAGKVLMGEHVPRGTFVLGRVSKGSSIPNSRLCDLKLKAK